MYGQAGTGVSQEVALERSERGVLGGLGHGLQGSGDGKDTEAEGWQRQIFLLKRTPLVALSRERDWWLRATVRC